jgi:phosphoribosylformylglycinamidine cyclo-ligase
MSERYAAAGVDTSQADAGVGALVSVLGKAAIDRESASVVPSGHYASVLRVAENLGIAISTDGVGSKLVIAEQADRLETVGIDCIAMNVNDLICVGAEPIALVDYLAVEDPDPGRLGRIAEGLRVGAEQANIEIPGGELAVIPELIRGHPSPGGFDLCATAIGTVALDAIITGEDAKPGDVLIGVPASGIHSNGYTLARRALLKDGGLALDDRPDSLGGASVIDALLEPTVIYVKGTVELLRSEIDVKGLAHITGGGVLNLLRLGYGKHGFEIDTPLDVTPVFGLIAETGRVDPAEMWEVFNMGCGFVAAVDPADADGAAKILAKHHPGARAIGTITADAGKVSLPSLALSGDSTGLKAT